MTDKKRQGMTGAARQRKERNTGQEKARHDTLRQDRTERKQGKKARQNKSHTRIDR